MQSGISVQIHIVGHTNTDAKLLSSLIIEKIHNKDSVAFKLVCQYGKLQNAFSIENLVDLKYVCPQKLKQLDVDEFKDISFVDACDMRGVKMTCGMPFSSCDEMTSLYLKLYNQKTNQPIELFITGACAEGQSYCPQLGGNYMGPNIDYMFTLGTLNFEDELISIEKCPLFVRVK
ncbi:unnamed protein product [Didymodactylos carnosus]|uniref:Uncharacterized protein n=1 Tax=Didymodactylos carnosus TaxID=1234261 RepID=A0A815UD02_9BILA|nr:unnamed protein product [Didymodactylos carnosus]CAF1514550.1 unnamed protein product [Didymodactylos carnosus]CAF3774964.1 unnamed protein product [Didymodactylos carnosus]CAF4374714.1 unnamed protein product [Didymodactylos carnosus]